MKNLPKYSYKLRPGYGSKELLIELDGKTQTNELITDLIRILEQNGFRQQDLKEGWQQDDWQMVFESEKRTLLLSRDPWDGCFILGENGNQQDILKLDRTLSQNDLFEKQPVNEADYE